MIRFALLLGLLAGCGRSSDAQRFLRHMEENESLLQELAEETSPDRARLLVSDILDRLRAACELADDADLKEQFSRTLSDLQPYAEQRYNPSMLDRIRAACLDCHTRFNE